jgi:hypothetical protein
MPITKRTTESDVTIDLAYSNVTERWYAYLLDGDKDVIVYATADAMADALRNLADAMEEYEQ